MVRWVRVVLGATVVTVSLVWTLPAFAAGGPDLALHAVPETNNHFVRGGQGSAGFYLNEAPQSADADAVVTFQLPQTVSLTAVKQVTVVSSTPLNCAITATPNQYACDLGIVHAADCCAQIEIDFTIPLDAPIGPQDVNATIGSPAGPDPTPADNSDTYTFLITGTSHFTYSLIGPVIPAGGTALFVLTATNRGPDAAAHVIVNISQPVSKHFTYAHPTFNFVRFGSPNVGPGGNSVDWTIPQTLQPGDQARLTMTLTASGVDQVGSVSVSESSDSAGSCGAYENPYGDCGTTFTLHATALALTTPSPSPSGPTLAETGRPNTAIAEIGGAILVLGLVLLAAAQRHTGAGNRSHRR